ncbi:MULTISPECIES: c-type cytochrome [Kordiimonas]|jgi:mono/diheme cytochrome c family protein|uniref:c-type cytochrome n=1 Tax=Kordiimonas TaxID=288021 RepID=UPI00257F4040|nr:cytochrome c [Kordiimonas sp. UBA4487]
MNKMTVTVLVAFAVIASLFFLFMDLEETTKQQALALKLTPDDASVVKMGQSLYETHCAACHGAELQGEPNWRTRKPSGRLPAPPHDASGHTWHHPDHILFAITKFGPAAVAGDTRYESDMPAYADVLSDEEILAILSYIKSTWPDHIRMRHDLMRQGSESDD